MPRIIFSVLFILISSFGFSQVSVVPFSSGTNLCPGNTAGYTAFTDSIKIYETSVNSDMGFGISSRFFELSAPYGFEFNPGVGNVATSGGGVFSGQSITVTSNTIRVDYTLAAGSALTQDSIFIYGIEVLADTGVVSGMIFMTSDDAVINGNESADLVNHGTLTTSQSASINTSTDISCFGDATGSATITITGGTIDAYLWNDGSAQTTATAAGLIAGDYVGLINFNTFCWASDTVSILEPVGPAISVSIVTSSDVTVNGGSDGWANSSASGGSGSISYSWSSTPIGYSSSIATATSLSARTYTITVTDDSSCTDQDIIIINEPDPPVDAGTITGSQDACQGTTPSTLTETIAASGGNGSYTYLWQESTDLSTWSNAFGTNNNITYSPPPLGQTTYFRRQVTSNADVAYSNILVINYRATPSVGISSLNTTYCVDEGIVTITGYPTNALGSFSPTSAALVDNGNGTASLNTGTIGSGALTVTYNYTDAFGCSASDNTSTTINLLPTVNFTGFTDGTSVSSTDSPIALTGSPSGGTFSGEGISGTVFYPGIADVGGPYPITYTYTDPGTGCTNTSVKNITVTGASTQIIGNLQSQYCVNAGSSTLTGPGDGDFVTQAGLTNGAGSTGTWNPSVAGVGTKTIVFNMEIDLGPFGTINFPVLGITQVNALPNVDITGLETTYCDNDPDDVIFGTPSGGTWSGDVSSSIFSPSTLGAGNYTNITYSYTDGGTGCTNSDTKSTIVHGVLTPTISGQPVAPIADQYCEDAAIDTYTGSPATVASYFDGQGISNTGTGTATFNPGLVATGSHQIDYIYIDGNGCSETASITVTVDPLPNVLISGFSQSEYCEDDPTITITGNHQPNGSFSGASISDNLNGTADFDPSSVPSETSQTIFYTYTDANFCTNTTSETVYINSLPEVDLIFGTDPDSVFCTNEGEVSLIGSPVGVLGVNAFFSGTGVSSDEFFPIIATAGNHILTYTYTHPLTGCVNSTNRTAVVYSPPVASITGLPTTPITNQYCIDAAKDTIQGFPVGNSSFNGVGITDFGNGTAQFDPAAASTGTYTIQYIYIDNNQCTDTASESITVDPLPNVFISGLTQSEYCEDDPIITITGNQQPNGSFSGSSITDNLNGTADFDPSSVPSETSQTIIYSYTDANFCTNTSSETVYINSLPDIDLIFGTDPDTVFCTNEDEVSLIGSPVGVLGVNASFSGTGVSVDEFFPSVATSGNHNLTYTYTHPITGCTNLATRTAIVYNPPVASITGLPTSPIANQYCIDAQNDTIQGFPMGNGYFIGNGITDFGNNTAQFDPDNATDGSHIISYIFEDVNNCIDTASQVVEVDPLPIVLLSGFTSDEYCEDNAVINISGNQSFGSFTGAGVIDNSDGTATFDPGSVISDSTYRITYSYVDANFCTDTAEENITIYKLPTVTLTIASYPDTSFCESDAAVTLIGSPIGNLGTTSIYSGPGVAGPSFAPSSTIIGLDTIVYYYRDGNGCENRDTQEVFVYPNPIASIDVLNHCNNDSIAFADSSTISPAPSSITQWNWTFGDIVSGANNTSTLQNPKHFYHTPGTYQISLTTTSNFGCQNTTQVIDTIGEPPVAEIIYDNVCLGQITQFSDSLSQTNNDVVLWEWDFGDGDTSMLSDPQHLYNTMASYPVQLKITTKSGCVDSITQIINVRPVVNSFPYFEDFESGNGNWFPENETGDTTNSWAIGTPSGAIISNAYSGTQAYTLNQNGNYYDGEISYVEGPCFDLSLIERPMIHLDYKSAFTDTDDGVVLQYQYTDKSTATQIPWTNVGDIINNTGTGINWYNSATIDANPGGKSRGWTGFTTNASDNNWLEGRHHLDFLVQDTNIQNIRFRLAFASDNSSSNEGFAFDDIWVGNRQRLVLAEHFTNNSAICDSCEIADDAVDQLISDYSDPMDVIDIQYHINSPGDDHLHLDNTADPNSRLLFYSIAEASTLVMDGNQYQAGSYEWANDSTYMRMRSLQDPKFDMSLGYQVNGNSIDIQTRMEAIDSITGEDLVLRVVLVEKNVYSIGGNGDGQFHNVMRKMLPNAGGIDLDNYLKNWIPGDTIIDSLSHTFFNFDDMDQLGIIAFIQNNNTKEVYQAVYRDAEGTVTGLPDYISEDIGLDFLLFPNPSSGNVNLVFKEDLRSNTQAYIYNSIGQIQDVFEIESGLTNTQFNLNGYSSGVYLLKLVTDNKVAGIKRLIIQN